MSVGDLHDVERTGDFAVTRLRRRPKMQVAVDPTASVPIAVLTEDAALADAIHDAAAANHPVATASTVDEAIELATHGRCSILITDQISNQQALRLMTQRLREAQPALVVIAIGCASDQQGLISLLSAGVVDRLMLKPVTPVARTDRAQVRSSTAPHVARRRHRRDLVARAAVSAARARSRAGRAATSCRRQRPDRGEARPQPSPPRSSCLRR